MKWWVREVDQSYSIQPLDDLVNGTCSLPHEDVGLLCVRRSV